MITVMHVVDLPVSNPWLNGVARHYNRSCFRHLVTSIGPRNGMHAALEELNVRTFALKARSRLHYPSAILRLTSLLRREKVDIVQTHLFDPSTVGLLAAGASARSLKIVTRHHSDFTTLFNRPIHRRIDRWHALASDKVMAASEAVKRAMIRYEGVPGKRIKVARYGYDFNLLRPRLSSDERRRLRDKLGGDRNWFIGIVSRLCIEKGHEYLLQAVPTVVKQYPEARFLLVGSGPLREKLQHTVDNLGIRKHVQFLGWRKDTWNIIEAMDLMVHPSLHEAFCSVIIESMALGRPLVATNVAAAPEQIRHMETGILVPPRDPNAIARSIVSMMNDPEKAVRMGKNARRSVNERFNFPRMMRFYESCYKKWFEKKRVMKNSATACSTS